MDERTQIKYEKVTGAVDTIGTNKNNLMDILASDEQIMNNTTNAGVLEGQAANELETKFQELKKKFDAYIQTVTEFESMITFAKEETEGTEAAIKRAASDLAS